MTQYCGKQVSMEKRNSKECDQTPCYNLLTLWSLQLLRVRAKSAIFPFVGPFAACWEESETGAIMYHF